MNPILHRAAFQTPVGTMIAVASESGLCALEFDLPIRQKLLDARLRRWLADYEIEPMDVNFRAPIVGWLDAYFSGEFPEPPPLDLRGSGFERKVWTALLAIPVSKTTSYGCLAERLGMSGTAARAVGSAVRRNPLSIIVPCHRVIGSNGELRGYGGGLPQKTWLLKHEGALT